MLCVCRLFGFVFPARDQKQTQQQQQVKQLFNCLMYEAEGSGKAVSGYMPWLVMCSASTTYPVFLYSLCIECVTLL